MNSIENLKKTALIFFVGLGFGHIISGLMAANNSFLPLSLIINRILEIPFATIAIIYGLTNLRSQIKTENKQLDLSLIIVASTLFIGLIAINILLPEKTTL